MKLSKVVINLRSQFKRLGPYTPYGHNFRCDLYGNKSYYSGMFLKNNGVEFHEKYGGGYYRLTSKAHDFINSTYYNLSLNYELDFDKESYRKWLCSDRWDREWKTKKYHYHAKRFGFSFSKKAYIKQPHHKKKESDEKTEAKKAWREHRQLRRDKSKYSQRWGHSYHLNTSGKRISNKMYRRLEKQSLFREKDDLLEDKIHRRIFQYDIW